MTPGSPTFLAADFRCLRRRIPRSSGNPSRTHSLQFGNVVRPLRWPGQLQLLHFPPDADEPGDVARFYRDGQISSAGEVIEKIRNPQLARELWRKRNRDGAGWGPVFQKGTPPKEEARIILESWRVEYNTQRPYSELGYGPPAPAAGSLWGRPNHISRLTAVM